MNIIEIFKKFPTQKDCIKHLEKTRWNNKPICPYCSGDNTYNLIHAERYRHHCNQCSKSFSVTVGTIFHDTRLPLQKWFLAIALILNAKKGISSRQLARDLDVHVETAWSMGYRIRKAMVENEANLLTGIVEMDETYIGGKPRKQARKDKDDDQNKRGRGTKKQAVVGIIERNGKVRTKVASKNKLTFSVLSQLVRKHIDVNNATLYTDEFRSYSKMNTIIAHRQIDHSKKVFSINGISTNCIESFWAILKRGIIGQFHKVSKKYLNKYLDEFCWRFNNRKNENAFNNLMSNMLFT